MATFQGFSCDSCGDIIEKGQRTKRTTRLEGAVREGEYHEDLCPDCVAIPEGITLKAIPRRKKKGDQPSSATHPHGAVA